MLDKKELEKELVKALRACAKGCECSECPYDEEACPSSDDMFETAADTIERLAKEKEELISRVPKWIDANERLPEKSGEYIVFLKATKKWIDAGEDVSYTTAMWFVKEQKVWKEMNGEDSYNAVLSAVDTDWACSVTHWMELPKPPVNKESEDAV